MTVTPGWSEAYGLFTSGEADMVLSFTTSPAYHIIAEGDETKAAAIFPGTPLLDLGIHASGTASALVDYTVEPPRHIRGASGASGADSGP